MSEIAIATSSDAREIAEVHASSSLAVYTGLLPPDQLARFSVEERFRRWSAILDGRGEPGTQTAIARDDGVVSGFVNYGASRDGDVDRAAVGEIWALYVTPPAWSKRIGWSLFSFAARSLGELGKREVTLWVLDRNPRARSFYERVGMKLDPSKTKGAANQLEVRYRMEIR